LQNITDAPTAPASPKPPRFAYFLNTLCAIFEINTLTLDHRMELRRRRAKRELIPTDPAASFAARRFRPAYFPFEWHYHPEIELTYIVSGAGLRFVGDSIEAFGPGDCVLIGANVPHTWQSSDGERGPVESIVFQFSADLWGQSLGALPEFRPVAQALAEAQRGISVDDAGWRARLRQQMATVLEAAPDSLDRILGLMRSLHLIAEARHQMPEAVRAISSRLPAESRGGDAGTRRLERVLQLLHESLHDGGGLSQAEMATRVGMSPASFSRFFRRSVGRTFARYVNEWRIELACRRLVLTDEPITAIAFACGFENLSNFNRRFREIKAMTPRMLRERSRGTGVATRD
jgi:AraC-like DNA-binding protein/mannose-6-phosphate isomerase-like protein (cupin superfamily)